MVEQLSRKQQCVRRESHHRVQNLARVPGVGLLNRTCKSRAERHEVQLLRGLPGLEALVESSIFRLFCLEGGKLKLELSTFPGCVAQTAELSSHKRKVGGSTPPTATRLFGLVM